MAALRLLLAAFASVFVCVDCFLISDLTDYGSYDKDCVALWLWTHNSFDMAEWMQNRVDECRSYNDKLEKSFYDSVEELISAKPHRQCVMKLLRHHNASDVFIKAIAYNYFKEQLVSFSPNATCEGVVDVLRVDNEGENREMDVNFIGDDKSLWKLRPCLNDLFGAFGVREIVFVNQGERIGARSFGTHLKSYFIELYESAEAFYNDTLLREKFALVSSRATEVYNQTQLDCFRMMFVEQEIIEPSSYRFIDTIDINSDPEYISTCTEIMQEEIEKSVAVDLFGFTESSQRVKNCIIEKNVLKQFIEPVVIIPAVAKIIELLESRANVTYDVYSANVKRTIRATFDCLEQF
jgi:hypothetical protein